MPWKTLLIVLAVSVACWAVVMALFSLLSRKPAGLGMSEGRLRPCPGTPNCVCSQDADAGHAIEPFAFVGDPAAAWARLRAVLAAWPRTRIVTDQPAYLHAECTSLIFRFVDDVEFRLDAEGQRIHVRSASRAGRSDLGVNRARAESLRAAFQAAGR